MSEPPDLYHVLGVSRSVAPEGVRAAYVRLLKQNHPDHVRRGPPTQRLQHLQHAYRILRDPERRAAHDRLLEERDLAHRAEMLRAQRRIRRLDRPVRRRRRRGIAWPTGLLLVGAGGLVLLGAYTLIAG